MHYVIQIASCCFKDSALGKIVTYGAIVIFNNIFCNSLLFFYGNVDIGSLFSFLLYYKISNLLRIGKTLENFLHSSCTNINNCFDFACSISVYSNTFLDVLDTLYFIEEVSTYIYIFTVYKRQTKLRKISYNGRINHDQFKFTIPTLIITTYVLLTTVFQKFLVIFHDDSVT